MVEPLHQVRAALEQVRELLMAPSMDHLDRCAPALESAVGQMALLDASLRAGHDRGGAPLRSDLDAIRRDLIATGSLFQQAGEFHRNWAVVMGLVNSGYTAAGGLASLGEPERIAVRG